MSSHHIIREDQEPALLIDDASAANFGSIQQLLEWSPTVIVTQAALEQVLTWGIKIDVAIVSESDLDHWKPALQEQAPVKILTAKADYDAVETALYFLIASKQKAVNIIANTALERFEKFSSMYVGVIRDGQRWVFIPSGHFEKWLPAGTLLLLYPEDAHQEMPIENDGIVTVTRDASFWICEKN